MLVLLNISRWISGILCLASMLAIIFYRPITRAVHVSRPLLLLEGMVMICTMLIYIAADSRYRSQTEVHDSYPDKEGGDGIQSLLPPPPEM